MCSCFPRNKLNRTLRSIKSNIRFDLPFVRFFLSRWETSDGRWRKKNQNKKTNIHLYRELARAVINLKKETEKRTGYEMDTLTKDLYFLIFGWIVLLSLKQAGKKNDKKKCLSSLYTQARDNNERLNNDINRNLIKENVNFLKYVRRDFQSFIVSPSLVYRTAFVSLHILLKFRTNSSPLSSSSTA